MKFNTNDSFPPTTFHVLVQFQPPILFANQIAIARVCMRDISLDDSHPIFCPNVIEPEPEEDFLPKSIPDVNDLKTFPEKKGLIDRWKAGELDQWAKTKLSLPMQNALADSTGVSKIQKKNDHGWFSNQVHRYFQI